MLGILAAEQGEFDTAKTSFNTALEEARVVGSTRVTASALDSGGSATMAFDGKLLSRPSDRGGERAVAEALALFYYGVYVPPLASKAVPSSAVALGGRLCQVPRP